MNRPKMGFTLPWEEWMRRELKDPVSSVWKGSHSDLFRPMASIGSGTGS